MKTSRKCSCSHDSFEKDLLLLATFAILLDAATTTMDDYRREVEKHARNLVRVGLETFPNQDTIKQRLRLGEIGGLKGLRSSSPGISCAGRSNARLQRILSASQSPSTTVLPVGLVSYVIRSVGLPIHVLVAKIG